MPRGHKNAPPRTQQTALREPGKDTTLLGSDDETDAMVETYHEALTRRMEATKDEVAAKTELLDRFEKLGVGPDREGGPEYTTAAGRKIVVKIAKRRLSFVKAKGADEEEADGEVDEDEGAAANTH